MIHSSLATGAMATAGFGGLTLLWGNIKGVFTRFESLFIVKVQLSGNSLDDFMFYCWSHFKISPVGVRRFCSGDYYVKNKQRIARVVSEKIGGNLTFWHKFRPIFLSYNDKNGDNSAQISFIRGTFDTEKLLIESTNFYDRTLHEKTSKNNRYRVKKCFGRKTNPSMSKDEPETARNDNYDNGNVPHDFRPLSYSKEDLGYPVEKDPMFNLAYEQHVEDFFEECRRWKESKKWFKDKGLPWRLGAGLFGPPGTGKTSLTRALGQSLDLPIHAYDLTTMDNEELVKFWQESLSMAPCIVLLEDVDRIFDENKQIKGNHNKSPLTLDCLLNCISGVQPSDGILVIVTANDVSKLDSALGVPDSTGKSTRPGRLDRALYIGALTEAGRYKIANRILSDMPEMVQEVVKLGEGETGAQFESRCSRLALEHYWGKFKVYGDKNISFDSLPSVDSTTGETLDEICREASYD